MIDNTVICRCHGPRFDAFTVEFGTDYETENVTILVKEDSKSEGDTVQPASSVLAFLGAGDGCRRTQT